MGNLVTVSATETVGSRAGEGWDGWGDWQLSTAETIIDWRSAFPIVLDLPSGAIFSRYSKHMLLTCDFVDGGTAGLCAVGEIFPFSYLA